MGTCLQGRQRVAETGISLACRADRTCAYSISFKTNLTFISNNRCAGPISGWIQTRPTDCSSPLIGCIRYVYLRTSKWKLCFVFEKSRVQTSAWRPSIVTGLSFFNREKKTQSTQLRIYININQLDALNFIMSLFHVSTCFEHTCSSLGGQNCTIQPLVSSHL